LIALVALLALVQAGGAWDLLGNSRLLDVLHRGGVIAVTDADQGIVAGVPSLDYYVAATDPIDWELVLVAAGLFALSWLARGVQFHGVARAFGIGGPPAAHVRARLYGLATDRLLPYGAGRPSSPARSSWSQRSRSSPSTGCSPSGSGCGPGSSSGRS
jgi:hypothetical protein